MSDVLDAMDVQKFAADADIDQLVDLVDEANAMALSLAPCLSSTTDAAVTLQARGILRDVVLRRLEYGAGALQGQVQIAGPFSLSQTMDTRQERRALLWPSEITALQALCATSAGRRVHQASLI